MLKEPRPLRVAVLCSQRAPGLDHLLHHEERGRTCEIACVITSEPGLASRDAIEDAGVPVLLHPIRRFHDDCGSSLHDLEARRSYDAMTVHVLEQLNVDVVLLLGYLYVLTDVVLARYPGRIFNIHDSDLGLELPNGQRRFVGLHSTRDAILAGVTETRSTLHVVTARLDGGPIVLRSGPYPVAPFVHRAAAAGHFDIVKAYAYAQREWMMRDSWGRMAMRTLALMQMDGGAGIERAAAEVLGEPVP